MFEPFAHQFDASSQLINFFNLLNSKLISRSFEHKDITSMFDQLYRDNPRLTLKYIIVIRRMTKTLKQNEILHELYKHIAINHPDLFCDRFLDVMTNNDSFSDLYLFIKHGNESVQECVLSYMRMLFLDDISRMNNHMKISTLCNHLKSENVTSKNSKRLGKLTRKHFELTAKQYRKSLTSLRSYIVFNNRDMERTIEYNDIHHLAHDYFSKDHPDIENKWHHMCNPLYDPYKSSNKFKAIVYSCVDLHTLTSDITHLYRASIYTLMRRFSEVNSSKFQNLVYVPHKPFMIPYDTIKPSLCDRQSMKYMSNNIKRFDSVLTSILVHGINNQILPEDMPDYLFVIIDETIKYKSYYTAIVQLQQTYSGIYQKHNYKCPQLVIWNIYSRIQSSNIYDGSIINIEGFTLEMASYLFTMQPISQESFAKYLVNDYYRSSIGQGIFRLFGFE